MDEEKEREKRAFTRRFNLIFFLIFLLFVTLVLRLAFLQLVEGEKYVRAASQLSVKSLYTKATRGWIYDRNGEVLVNNIPVYSITFTDNNNLKKDQLIAIAEQLEKLLLPVDKQYTRVKILEKMDVGYVYKRKEGITATNQSAEEENWRFNPDEWVLTESGINLPRYQPREIATDVPKEVMFYIEEHRPELPGVDVFVDSLRQYKKGNFATHILGYTRAIPREKVDDYLAKGYSPNDKVGITGVELYYEDQLRGKEGIKEVTINNQSKTMQTEEVLSQKPGNNLVLTIDWRYQKRVEEILEEGVKYLQTRPKDPLPNVNSAIAVVMDPKTGEIKALANYPSYDLNVWTSPDFNKRYSEEVAGKERNQAIAGAFAPGSTIKMLSVMIGLQEGIVTPNEKILSTGRYKVGNLYKGDFKAGGHGWVDARKAIKESVNTYMYEIAMRLAKRSGYPAKKTSYIENFDLLRYYDHQFGLGVKTGIDLPGESIGWPANSTELGRLADAMIGQYDNFTPIQIVQYVSAIANGGYRMRPFVVKEIREPIANMDGPGKLLMTNEPEVLNKVEIDPEILKIVQEGMLEVTQPGGTAYSTFAGTPFRVAAKTGTVQRGGGNKNGLMVGYAPYDDPQMAFVVVVPGGIGGSDSAGPIARNLVDAFFGLDQPKQSEEVPASVQNENTPSAADEGQSN